MVHSFAEAVGLLMFAAGAAGTLYAAPGLTPLLALAALPIVLRAWRNRPVNQPANEPAWAFLFVFWSLALLMAVSPLLFTAAFATFWVVCAALAGGFRPAMAPADPDPAALIASVTSALIGLGLILRQTLIAERSTNVHEVAETSTAGHDADEST